MGSILAATAGPAIVRAASLMPIYVPRSTEILLPKWLELDNFDLAYPEMTFEVQFNPHDGPARVRTKAESVRKIWIGRVLVWEHGK